jgi:E3 ubiquitin-protein ligase DOA10
MQYSFPFFYVALLWPKICIIVYLSVCLLFCLKNYQAIVLHKKSSLLRPAINILILPVNAKLSERLMYHHPTIESKPPLCQLVQEQFSFVTSEFC